MAERNWKSLLEISGPLLTVAGLLLGVWQFNRGEENRTRLEYELIKKKDETEFRRKLWLERLSTYQTVAKTAGEIAASTDDDKQFKEKTREFLSAYWGSMILVEDKSVEKAMMAFQDAIRDFNDGYSKAADVRKKALELVTKCRESVQRGEQ